MTGRRGGRASDRAGARDIAMDAGNNVAGGLVDGYNPKPSQKGWQGQGGSKGEWGKTQNKGAGGSVVTTGNFHVGSGARSSFDSELRETEKDNKPALGRRGARPSDKAGARDMEQPLDTKMAFGSKKPAQDSFAAQKKELENKLKSGMLSKKRYDELLAKLENPDAVIEYKQSGFERSGRSKEGTSVPAGEGEFKGYSTDAKGAKDELTPAESKRFEELKQRRDRHEILQGKDLEEFERLRDKIGRIGFKSAGARRGQDSDPGSGPKGSGHPNLQSPYGREIRLSS